MKFYFNIESCIFVTLLGVPVISPYTSQFIKSLGLAALVIENYGHLNSGIWFFFFKDFQYNS